MFRIIFSLLLLACLLPGCQCAVLPTLTPQPTLTRQTQRTVTPAPENTATVVRPTLTATHTKESPQPVSLDASIPALRGKIAFYTTTGRLAMIDLSSGTGWQVTIPAPNGLSWSPDGSQLLVRRPVRENNPDGFDEYILYDAQGKQLNTFEADYANWGKDGTLNDRYGIPANRVVAPDGATAWINGYWVGEKLQLHLQDSPNASEHTVSLDAFHVNTQFWLYALFPNTHNLIGYMPQYSVVNSDMIGDEMAWIDTQAQKIHATGLYGHLRGMGLSELNGDILALMDHQWPVTPFGRLALLNGRTGQVQFPLPESTVVRELTWLPGSSEWLALATALREGTDQKPDPYMPVAGIYLYNFRSGEVCLLVQTAAGWRDGALRWSKDGKFLIYAHFEYFEEHPTASLMLYRMADGKVWALVTGLDSPGKIGPYLYWGKRVAVFLE